MSAKTLKIEITPSDGIQNYWIAVGDEDVTIHNDKGEIAIESPAQHYLVWWMSGNEGSSIGIEGKIGSTIKVEVKKSSIPKNTSEGAGFKKFKI